METTSTVYEMWVLSCGFLSGMGAGFVLWLIQILHKKRFDFIVEFSLLMGILYALTLKSAMGYNFTDLLGFEQVDFSAGIGLGVAVVGSLYWLLNNRLGDFTKELLAVKSEHRSYKFNYHNLNTKSLRLIASISKVPYYSRYPKSYLIQILEGQEWKHQN